ncbi:MAG: nucleoside hydrolase [Dehalococcoidia bacterium]
MTSGERQRVIIDCDPGHDDAVAILLAAKHLDVLGITTVSGNQTIEKVTGNALKVLELSELTGIPVARGATRPLLSQPRYATGHGESGLDGHDFPEPVTLLDPRHAVQFIIDTVMSTEAVTLVPIGPLTNIATALRLEPRLAERTAHISLMGGSATVGNVTPVAEFNVWVDAEAADIVFRSGIPITMCGLNLTHQATIGESDIGAIRAISNPVAKVIADLLGFYLSATRARSGRDECYVHDACAVAALIDPSLFAFADMHVAVETRGARTYGMTVCDARFPSPSPTVNALRSAAGAERPNARVAMKLDRNGFFRLLTDMLASYG